MASAQPLARMLEAFVLEVSEAIFVLYRKAQRSNIDALPQVNILYVREVLVSCSVTEYEDQKLAAIQANTSAETELAKGTDPVEACRVALEAKTFIASSVFNKFCLPDRIRFRKQNVCCGTYRGGPSGYCL